MRLPKDLEIDLKVIGAGQAEPQFFGVAADFVVIDGKAGAQNNVIQPVQRRAAKSVFFGERRQRRGGRIGRDAKNDVVMGINLPLQIQFPPGGVKGRGGQIEVAAAGDLVGEQIAACQLQFRQPAVFQSLIKHIIRVALDGQALVLEEREIRDPARVRQVDENGDALPGFRERRQFSTGASG